MKTIFDKPTRDGLIERINTLNEGSMAQWGKMNLYQMLRHCIIWEEWIQGKNSLAYKQKFIGLLFGKMVLKSLVKDDRPMKRNSPAGAGFTVKERDGDIQPLITKWILLIQDYEQYSNPGFIHDFFGKMTKEQIGILAYKHTDHHLRQFMAN